MPPSPIAIRRAAPTDAAAFARLMGHADVLANLMQTPYSSETRWLAQLTDGLAPGKTDLSLVAELPDAHGDLQVVASAGLYVSNPALRRRHVMGLGIAVAPGAQRQGVGAALMHALCNWADDWGQVLRIELTVFADNARAIRLYQHCGFVREGLHRGYALRHGHYADVVSMARLHPQPPRWGAPGSGGDNSPLAPQS